MKDALSRRSWLAGSAGVVAASAGLANTAEPPALDIIDCHTHFYDPSRPEGIPWPAKNSPLYRTVLPVHLRRLKQYRKVTGTVIVEASSRIEDNQWLLDLAENDPFIVGIVGRLEPGSEGFAGQVDRFAANRLFRGIRISSNLLQMLVDKNQLDDLKRLADRNLALDVNGGPNTPAIIAAAAKQLSSLRFVLNHIGNVAITSKPPPEDWVAGIRAAASRANVYCKISALVEGAARNGRSAPTTMSFYRPYIDVVWNAFGEDRVIYGSNWPVSDRAASYETLQRIVMEYAMAKGENATRKFCSLNAQKAYLWVEREGRRAL